MNDTRELVVQQWVTVDNIAAEQDGGLSFVTRDPANTIRELKDQHGKNIWLWGSLKLMHCLMDAALVDDVRMLVCPASRGTGTRVFADRQHLKLLEATAYENGVALLRYELRN